MIARKTIVVPCMVNSALNVCALTSVLSGRASCSAHDERLEPADQEEDEAEVPYRMPMRLWSTVVSQDQSTPWRLALRSPSRHECGLGRHGASSSFQAQEVGGERLGLLAR